VNSVSRPELCDLLGVRSLESEKTLDAARLSELFGVPQNALSYSIGPDKYRIGALKWVQPTIYDSYHPRYCPECARDSFHTPFFDLSWVVRCPIHNAPLLEACPKCHTSVWPRLADAGRPGCRNCGYDIFALGRGPRSHGGLDVAPYLSWVRAVEERVSHHAVLFGCSLSKLSYGDPSVPNWNNLPGYLLRLTPWRGDVCPIGSAPETYYRRELLPSVARLVTWLLPPFEILHGFETLNPHRLPQWAKRNLQIIERTADRTYRAAKRRLLNGGAAHRLRRVPTLASTEEDGRADLALSIWTQHWETQVNRGGWRQIAGYPICTYRADHTFVTLAASFAPCKSTSRAHDAAAILCEWIMRRLFDAYVWASLEAAWQLSSLANGNASRVRTSYQSALRAAAPTFLLDYNDTSGPALHWWAQRFTAGPPNREGFESHFVSPSTDTLRAETDDQVQ
jgi:hypothetical protein